MFEVSRSNRPTQCGSSSFSGDAVWLDVFVVVAGAIGNGFGLIFDTRSDLRKWLPDCKV